jgi:hypothetical protein
VSAPPGAAPGTLFTAAFAPNDTTVRASCAIEAPEEPPVGGSAAMPATVHSKLSDLVDRVVEHGRRVDPDRRMTAKFQIFWPDLPLPAPQPDLTPMR